MEEPLCTIDLKSAYLQIHVDSSLWKYQQVKYKGQTYVLTRLGFGLNCAPRIMSEILSKVLAQSEQVKQGTDHFMDDIIVQENIVTAAEVAAHLQRYGLETKPPEPLDGGRVLGLQLKRDDRGDLQFSRGNEVPTADLQSGLTRRELFSICGRLVGHYPVCSWLRVACSYIKRRSEGVRWEEDVGMDVRLMLDELLKRVRESDPVKGPWLVRNQEKKGQVWCDASSLAIGVALEINGVIVEDAAWMRKISDYNHISIAELDAAVRGVNLSLKWGLQSVEVITDSVTKKMDDFRIRRKLQGKSFRYVRASGQTPSGALQGDGGFVFDGRDSSPGGIQEK